jgi:hypothetical protein
MKQMNDINQFMINQVMNEPDHKDQDAFDGGNIADDSGYPRRKAQMNHATFSNPPQGKTQLSAHTTASCILDTRSTHPKFNG